MKSQVSRVGITMAVTLLWLEVQAPPVMEHTKLRMHTVIEV
jgi:hypothetical protein